ncbi:Secreted nematode Clade V Protein gene family [Caenorhabditis elegans]|uniref:Secreted nematode Clade V Protein gene family n=1 Tax=Caenorhabditis elegans TaxID=6239 RepID=Q20972_CAEEL|nr:Secreted nematode Clade V Protein gene family [Caenorhabditis elegans]CAA98494.1 Secreted nematode Clade V Protein gene family [Caenorhabditis elegans]|eukprot:NP_505787.1 Secreted nematode Clade V Protein gene family [Caenorhabditis elegans]
MITSYILLFASVVCLGFCALDDQLLTEEGSGFEPPPIVNITVELVSNRSFDPEKNASNLKIVKDAVDDYSKKENIRYPSDNIKQSIIDHGGKFAVLFEIRDDARCDEVRRFVKGAKKHSNELSYAVLKCDGEKTQIL